MAHEGEVRSFGKVRNVQGESCWHTQRLDEKDQNQMENASVIS